MPYQVSSLYSMYQLGFMKLVHYFHKKLGHYTTLISLILRLVKQLALMVLTWNNVEVHYLRN